MTGREFHFPIDYTSKHHVNKTFNSNSVTNFAKEQEKILSCSREIFRVLIEESRAWHREYINASRPDPTIYDVGDVVLARREIQSNRKKVGWAKHRISLQDPGRFLNHYQVDPTRSNIL